MMGLDGHDGDLAEEVIKQQLSALLGANGFHIVHAFPVQLFNSQGCPDEHQLPTFGRGSTLGLVIGNNNALWPHFLRHLAVKPAALTAENPLDDLVESTVSQAVQQCLQNLSPQQQRPSQEGTSHQQQHQSTLPNSNCSCQPHGDVQPECGGPSSSISQPHSRPSFVIRFSHHHDPGKFVNMMRAAQLSGLAYYSSTTHLCMHPQFGPWFALRAVAVFDVDGPDPAGFSQLPCPYPDLEAEAAEKVGAVWRTSCALVTKLSIWQCRTSAW